METNALKARKFGSDAWPSEIVCRQCGHKETTLYLRNIDTVQHPEWKQALLDGGFFQWTCPACGCFAELNYPCRYLDPEERLNAVLNPGADESAVSAANGALAGNGVPGCLHRVVTSFYALREIVQIRAEKLDDRCIQLLKPLIIGQLQSQGQEIWNAFFTGTQVPPDEEERIDGVVYVSDRENAAPPYGETIYWFDVYSTKLERNRHGINQAAFDLCAHMLHSGEAGEDDGMFHQYDLSWAISFHNNAPGRNAE